MGKSMYAASAIQFNVSNNQAFHPTSDEETANQNLTENRARKLGTLQHNENNSNIFIVKKTEEREMQMHKYVHIRFVDYVKTFYKVKHKDPFELFGKLELFRKDVRTYPGSKLQVQNKN